MRLTRKTIVAVGLSGALTVVAGVWALAAVFGLPFLGFGEAAHGSAAPEVVHRTVYDDQYVTATTETPSGPSGSGASRGSSGATGSGAAVGASPTTQALQAPTKLTTAGSPQPSTAPTVQPAGAPATQPSHPATTEPTRAPATTRAPPATEPPPRADDPDPTTTTTAGLPPIPAGCREPEWDSEHRVWHCSDDRDG